MNYEQRITSQFEDVNLFNCWTSRYEYMIDFEKTSPPLPNQYRSNENLIEGCQSRVWRGAPSATITPLLSTLIVTLYKLNR